MNEEGRGRDLPAWGVRRRLPDRLLPLDIRPFPRWRRRDRLAELGVAPAWTWRTGDGKLHHILRALDDYQGALMVAVFRRRRNRKRAIRYDKRRYRGRYLIENAFCRLKDFRRVHTRYDKLSANYLSAVALATLVAFWL